VLRKILPVLLILPLLAACTLPGGSSSVPTAPQATATPSASPTPAAPLVILVMPADLPEQEYDRNQTLVYELAQQHGMRFQVRNSLTLEDLAFEGAALKVVISLAPDPGLASLTAAAPSVQFLAIGIPDLQAAPNLSILGAAGVPVDQQAFLAGYITAMLAPEWRVGILSQKDNPGGEAARFAFVNGFHYFCGACLNPYFTQPYAAGMYPIVVRIPAEALEGEYMAYADILLDNYVNAAFVYPAVADLDVLSYLADYGVLLVGQELPSEDLRGNWIVSIRPDLSSAIVSIFPELVAGRGGQTFPTPLFLDDINPGLLTEGKLPLVQQVLSGLQDGSIGTSVNP
jgi:hypothetical protein